MAFDFPSAPIVGQLFSPTPGAVYAFSGYSWDLQSAPPRSLTLTGDARAPTAAIGDADSTIATTAFVQREVTAAQPPQCGRLTLVSATQLKFAPFNGDRVKVNGVILAIPSGGITAANTGVRVDGFTGSNLAANTVYFVAITNVSGTPTLGFWTNLGQGHAISALSGNVGTEIIGGDNTLSLVGFIRTNASAQFVDSPSQRFVLSWFNRRNLPLQNAYTGISTTSTGWVELSASYRVEFLTWNDEDMLLLLSGCSYNTGQAANDASIAVDQNTSPANPTSYFLTAAYGYWGSHTMSLAGNLSEGYHYATQVVFTSANTAYFYIQLSGTISG